MHTTIHTRLGDRGQIVIPKRIRDLLGIRPGDDVVIQFRKGEVVLAPGGKAWLDRFAGIADGLWRDDKDIERFIREERKGWDRDR